MIVIIKAPPTLLYMYLNRKHRLLMLSCHEMSSVWDTSPIWKSISNARFGLCRHLRFKWVVSCAGATKYATKSSYCSNLNLTFMVRASRSSQSGIILITVRLRRQLKVSTDVRTYIESCSNMLRLESILNFNCNIDLGDAASTEPDFIFI